MVVKCGSVIHTSTRSVPLVITPLISLVKPYFGPVYIRMDEEEPLFSTWRGPGHVDEVTDGFCAVTLGVHHGKGYRVETRDPI